MQAKIKSLHKGLFRAFIILMSILPILGAAQVALAAGSSTTGVYVTFPNNSGVSSLTITYVADDTNGSIPDYVFTADITAALKGSFVILATTTPGTTAVDALDIVVTEALDVNDGVDVFGGNLTVRSATDGEQTIPLIITGAAGLRLCTGKTWTVGFSNNTTNDATGILVLYFMR